MTITTTANKEQLKELFDTESLADSFFKVTITPISEKEADDLEFKSLKGIAGKWLNIDEVRTERLNL